jgi:hypothetical protein
MMGKKKQKSKKNQNELARLISNDNIKTSLVSNLNTQITF